MHKAPERVRDYVKLIQQHRTWTLLNRKDGQPFRSFEEFCGAEQPWGLGTPYEKIRPYLEALHGKRAVDLMAVALARTGNQHTASPDATRPGDEKHTPPTDTRLRAILRAPEEVQRLYREGLISQKVAARLGPKRAEPETAYRIAEVVSKVREAPRERKAIYRVVLDTLGHPPPEPVERIRRMAERLDPESLARLVRELESLLKRKEEQY